MENKSKPLKRVIVACIAFCALFVAYISIQSWGTVEYLQEEFSGDLTARFALIGALSVGARLDSHFAGVFGSHLARRISRQTLHSRQSSLALRHVSSLFPLFYGGWQCGAIHLQGLCRNANLFALH